MYILVPLKIPHILMISSLCTCNSWVWEFNTVSFPSRSDFSPASSSLSDFSKVRVDSWTVSWVCQSELIRLGLHMITNHTFYYYHILHTCNSSVCDCSAISFPSRPVFSSANSSLSEVTEVRVDSWVVSWVCDQVRLIIIFNPSHKHSHLYSTCNSWVWDCSVASSSSRPDFSPASSSLSDFSKMRVDSWTVSWACETSNMTLSTVLSLLTPALIALELEGPGMSYILIFSYKPCVPATHESGTAAP